LPDSVHALDIEALKHPSIILFSALKPHDVIGYIAIKALTAIHGEIKFMSSVNSVRNLGMASALLNHLIFEA
tara:strand:+ start:243 stop:458 length:216 start_codon:yes stop_codon:yes gene_type:complete